MKTRIKSIDRESIDFDIASLTTEEECEALLRATGKWVEE